MNEESLLLKLYGNSPQMRILDYLMEFPKNKFTKNEILENIGMSKTTVYKYFDHLLEYGLIKQTEKIRKAQPYSIDMDNPIIQTMKHSISIASGKIADREMKKEKIRMFVRKLRNQEEAKDRIKLLQAELKYTKIEMKELTPILS